MRKTPIIFAIILIVLVILGLYVYQLIIVGRSFRGEAFPEPLPAKDFTLIDQYGRSTSLSEFKGDVIVLSFVYTHCPDVCPAIVIELNKAYKELVDQGVGGVKFVFVTVDPDRDTPEAFREWAKNLHAENFIYLTGQYDEVSQVWSDYGIYVEKVNASESMAMGHEGHTGYIVTHTAIVYLIDKDFRIRVAFDGPPPSWSYKDVVNDILILLNE